MLFFLIPPSEPSSVLLFRPVGRKREYHLYPTQTSHVRVIYTSATMKALRDTPKITCESLLLLTVALASKSYYAQPEVVGGVKLWASGYCVLRGYGIYSLVCGETEQMTVSRLNGHSGLQLRASHHFSLPMFAAIPCGGSNTFQPCS